MSCSSIVCCHNKTPRFHCRIINRESFTGHTQLHLDYNCGSPVSLGIRASEIITHSYFPALIAKGGPSSVFYRLKYSSNFHHDQRRPRDHSVGLKWKPHFSFLLAAYIPLVFVIHCCLKVHIFK